MSERTYSGVDAVDSVAPNRIASAIARKEKEIAERIADGRTTAEKVEKLRGELDMEFEEFCKFQELKSLAQAMGFLTLWEAQTVYACLGEQPSVFNRQSCAAKAVLTGLFSELIKMRIAGKL